jgi:hypothetical protein
MNAKKEIEQEVLNLCEKIGETWTDDDLFQFVDDFSPHLKASLERLYQIGMESNQEKMLWLLSSDTGISSKAIFRAMIGFPPQDKCTPCDPSDFGRCYRLLKMFPEWEARVKELGTLIDYSPKVNGEQRPNLWQIFADNYKKLCEMYEEECVGDYWKAPKLYKFMKDLGF